MELISHSLERQSLTTAFLHLDEADMYRHTIAHLIWPSGVCLATFAARKTHATRIR